MTKTTDSRHRIVQSALELFAGKGYASTSMADLAEQAGLLKGNLSYYFRTKAEVLEAVSEARREELFGRLERRLSKGMGPRERLLAFVDVFESTAEELASHGCPVGSLCSELGRTEPELRGHATRILEALSAWLRQEFSKMGNASRAHDHAEQLLAWCQGAAILAHTFQDPDVVRRQAAVARDWVQGLEFKIVTRKPKKRQRAVKTAVPS